MADVYGVASMTAQRALRELQNRRITYAVSGKGTFVHPDAFDLLRSGEQRFYERFLGFRFPMFFSGVADVCEWYDAAIGQYRIDVNVHNRRWGPLFGYNGHFDVEWLSMPPEQLPPRAKPRREERRE